MESLCKVSDWDMGSRSHNSIASLMEVWSLVIYLMLGRSHLHWTIILWPNDWNVQRSKLCICVAQQGKIYLNYIVSTLNARVWILHRNVFDSVFLARTNTVTESAHISLNINAAVVDVYRKRWKFFEIPGPWYCRLLKISHYPKKDITSQAKINYRISNVCYCAACN